MKYTVVDALMYLRPNKKWVVREINDEFVIEWNEESCEKPTNEEIQETITMLQEKYDALEYKRKRVNEYPTFGEQFDILYHEGYDAWKNAIKAIKDKYPK
jgi:hypothetical protein